VRAWNAVEIPQGTRFGFLTVIEEVSSSSKNRRFRCLCDCGREHETSYSCLRYGKTKSCGCLRSASLKEKHNKARGKPIVGLTNGSWKITSYSGRLYNCKCEICGNERTFNESSFKCGSISSCCLPVARNDVYIKKSIRSCINISISKRYKKTRKSEEMLGKPISEVIEYIESLWQPGMSWENKGTRDEFGWDIDHICPCSQAQNEDELIKLQHYTNLRPMWSMDNRIKCNARTPDGEEMCAKILGREWIDLPK
jgi:hypothetical protein